MLTDGASVSMLRSESSEAQMLVTGHESYNLQSTNYKANKHSFLCALLLVSSLNQSGFRAQPQCDEGEERNSENPEKERKKKERKRPTSTVQ